jgi:hypothetical protein
VLHVPATSPEVEPQLASTTPESSPESSPEKCGLVRTAFQARFQLREAGNGGLVRAAFQDTYNLQSRAAHKLEDVTDDEGTSDTPSPKAESRTTESAVAPSDEPVEQAVEQEAPVASHPDPTAESEPEEEPTPVKNPAHSWAYAAASSPSLSFAVLPRVEVEDTENQAQDSPSRTSVFGASLNKESGMRRRALSTAMYLSTPSPSRRRRHSTGDDSALRDEMLAIKAKSLGRRQSSSTQEKEAIKQLEGEIERLQAGPRFPGATTPEPFKRPGGAMSEKLGAPLATNFIVSPMQDEAEVCTSPGVA